MKKQMQTCCFTGHRELPEQVTDLQKKLELVLISLIEKGVIYYGAGGALGFDTLAACTVIKLRKKYPQIRLILVLPCRDQTRGWTYEDKTVYEGIKEQADKVVYVSQWYSRGCMHKRNRYLVENSGYCVCYLAKQTGGTAGTVNYAKKLGLSIFNLA